MRTCAAWFIKKSINWIVLSINWMKRKYRILEQHRRFISWPIRSSFQTITTLFKIRFCAKRMNSSETKTQKYNKTTKRQERRSHWISGLASKKIWFIHKQFIFFDYSIQIAKHLTNSTEMRLDFRWLVHKYYFHCFTVF